MPVLKQALLLAPEQSHEGPAPIYMKLTAQALEAIRSGGSALRLRIDQKTAVLSVGDLKFAASVTKEPATLEVYSQTGPSEYTSQGLVKQRLVLKATPLQAKGLPSRELNGIAKTSKLKSAGIGGSGGGGQGDRSSVQTRTSSPAVATRVKTPSKTNLLPKKYPSDLDLSKEPLRSDKMRILHLLALAPISIKDLALRTQVDKEIVEGLLDSVGVMNPQNNTFTLCDDFYKDIRFWEWKQYTPKERAFIMKAATQAFDHLQYPADHPARTKLKKPQKPEKPALVAKRSSSSQPSPAPRPNSKKLRVDKEMLQLVRKFRSQYSEYAKLYSVLVAAPKPPSMDLKRLMGMHHQLEDWKRQLWSHSQQGTDLK